VTSAGCPAGVARRAQARDGLAQGLHRLLGIAVAHRVAAGFEILGGGLIDQLDRHCDFHVHARAPSGPKGTPDRRRGCVGRDKTP
jgi:hypothetical protein